MEKNSPLELKLDVLIQDKIVRHNEYRFVTSDFGFVNNFAQLESSLLKTDQPYRIKEGRIILPLKGSAHISVNLIEYEISSPYTLIVIPPGSIVQLVKLTPDYDFQMIVPTDNFIQLPRTEELLDNYLSNRQNILVSLTEKEWEQIATYFSLIWNTLQETTFRREVVQHLLNALLYTIGYIRKNSRITNGTQLSRQEELFHRFIALVNEYCITERTVGFYADRLCLTPRYLNTIIRQTSQQTVMGWINQAVIQEAKVLLKHSNLLIYQIADKLSFPNSSFFCKFFKKMTGSTPHEYRKT